MASTSAARPAPTFYIQLQEMWERVRDPQHAQLYLKGFIDTGFKTGRIGLNQVHQFSREGNVCSVSEFSFYVKLRVQKNTDHINCVIRVIEWLLTQAFFWIPRNDRDVIVLPSTLFVGRSTGSISFHYQLQPIQLTVENPPGKTHAQAYADLQDQIVKLPPNGNPYLYPADVPDNELVIGKYLFPAETPIYTLEYQGTSNTKIALLIKEDCTKLGYQHAEIEYVEAPSFGIAAGGTLVAVFKLQQDPSLLARRQRTRGASPSPSPFSVYLIPVNDLLYVFCKNLDPVTMTRRHQEFACGIIDIGKAFPGKDLRNYNFQASLLGAQAVDPVFRQPIDCLLVNMNFIPKV
jgi:hypothetical protein